jgi:predicted DNA binding CopG/RHH family protein
MQILISQALRRPSVSVRIASHLFFEAKEEVKKHGMGYVIRRQSRAAHAGSDSLFA